MVASCTLWSSSTNGATSPSSSGLPLYQFVDTGVGPLPWNAVSLQSHLNHTTMVGGPHGATNANGGVIAYRDTSGDLIEVTLANDNTVHWSNVTASNDVPAPAADPIAFFDPYGNADLLYVDQAGHVILVSPNEIFPPWWAQLHRGTPWRPFVHTDLTELTGVVAANGLPSIQVAASTATVAFRTSSNAIEVLRLTWNNLDPLPIYAGVQHTITAPGARVSAPTTTTTGPSSTTTTPGGGTTTTTVATSSTDFASDPVVLPGLVAGIVTTLTNGSLVDYVNTGSSFATWGTQNITGATGSPRVSGTLSVAHSTSVADVAALSSAGTVELYTTNLSNLVTSPAPTTATSTSTSTSTTTTQPPANSVVTPSLPTSATTWNATAVTPLAAGAPPLAGTLALNVAGNQLSVAGQAANWGDLFVLTNTIGTSTWASADVSVTAGSNARTVSSVVTGLTVNGALTLYAAGVSSPPPQGVGVYAIPSATWSQSIQDGWPIISETGGLGTKSAPWVGFTSSGGVANSPDYLLGQSIYNAHRRVTWLSFWTVSGPLANETQTAATYFQHGFSAGAWVATQIDAYRGLGVGLKPDWVIFDPEGYPDNHSRLDVPGGATNATLAQYAAYWAAMLRGWASGLASVDPSLNAGVYASQSEYRNYQLSTSPLPVFMAVAFSGGGPIPVPGASGSNVRGFIAFGAQCTPKSTLAKEEQTLANPPWSGQFNTLQFNYGVYCAP